MQIKNILRNLFNFCKKKIEYFSNKIFRLYYTHIITKQIFNNITERKY